MNTKKKILIAAGIALLLIAGGAWVFVWQRQSVPAKLQRLLRQQEEVEKKIEQLKQQVEFADELEESQRRARRMDAEGIGVPDEVTVTTQGDKNIIRNEYGNYEITVPNTWVIAESGDASEINFFDKETYERNCKDCLALYIWIFNNNGGLPLDKWIGQNPDLAQTTDEKKAVTIAGASGYKYTDEYTKRIPDPDRINDPDAFVSEVTRQSFYYYLSFNNKVYKLFILEKNFDLSILETLKFFNQ